MRGARRHPHQTAPYPVDDAVTDLAHALPPVEAGVLLAEHARWSSTDTWRLINAADSCGT
ncbi:hypothetical protein GCM10022254_61490 [Actinomadura meridiana]|uniref:Transposase n=1 Tax=Actinomadura meridiana TaxID=559626 RepID=A0ABP8CJE7_9ACTN